MSMMAGSGLSGRKVMLTGSSGFVGQHVARAMAEAGASVRCFPDLPVDICEIARLATAAEGCHTVVHLAGPPSVSASWQHPDEFARVHVQGTAAVIEACAIAGASALLYMSSAEVYGRPASNPVHETALPAPLSPYGMSKYAAEQLVLQRAPALGIAATILRPFSIYGPGAPSKALIPTILSFVVQGEPITLRDLSPVRDYCFVDDVAAAVVAAIMHMPSQSVRTLNIGSGEGVSVRDLAERIRRLSGADLPIAEAAGAHRPGDSEIFELVADIGAAKDRLGWSPAVDLDTGLRSMLAVEAADIRCAT